MLNNRNATVIATPIKPVMPVLQKPQEGKPDQGYILRMPLSQWFTIPENPRQRDTENRANAALRKHLKAPHPTHRNVSAAKLPDGRMFKLDGHTRAFLWAAGKLKAPADGTVTVTVYAAHDRQEVMDLFDAFDNPSAVMTSQDRIAGGKREHELVLRSGCLSGTTSLHATSLKMADAIALHGVLEVQKAAPEHEIIGRWKPMLALVDAQGYHRVDTGLLAGVLITWLLHAGTPRLLSMADFWASYFEGCKSGEARHWLPMEAVRFRVETEKRIGAGRNLNARTLAYVCMALDAHFAGKTFLGKSEPVGLRLAEDTRPADVVMRHVQRHGGVPPLDQWEHVASKARF
ncbi:MAG: hypothetical protein ACYDB0_00900 [Acidithiobacillus sp.]